MKFKKKDKIIDPFYNELRILGTELRNGEWYYRFDSVTIDNAEYIYSEKCSLLDEKCQLKKIN